jgi:hypothetical protein
MFATEGLQDLLHVPVNDLGDGRVRVTYEFEDEKEATDFVHRPDYMLGRHQQYSPDVDRPGSPPLAIKNGSFGGEGWDCWVHKLTFEGAITIRFEVIYGGIKPGQDPVSSAFVGMGDDGSGGFIAVQDLGNIWVTGQNGKLIDYRGPEEGTPMSFGVAHEIELEFDGKKTVRTRVQGEPELESTRGVARAGGIFLWTHAGSEIEFSRLEIEGSLSSKGQFASGWMQARLTQIGLQD